MAMMSLRVPDQLALRFEAFAAARGGKSRVVRGLIESAVQGGAAVAEAGGPAPGRSTKVTLRLKDEDLVALDTACADTGLRRTEWLVAVIRWRLSGRPQFDRASAQALLEARRELRRIGVNLRELAGASPAADQKLLAELEALRAEVRDQLARVREAIAGNLSYWEA